MVGQVDAGDDLWFVFSLEAKIPGQGEQLYFGTSPAPYFHQTLGWRLLQPFITPSTNLFAPVFICFVFNPVIKNEHSFFLSKPFPSLSSYISASKASVMKDAFK